MAAGIYWFHWTQYLNPGVRKSVRSHFVLMHQRVERWNGRVLGVLSALKVGVQLHPPGDGRVPSLRKAIQERCQPQQRTPTTSLCKYLETWGPSRSGGERAWQWGHPEGRVQVCQSSLAAGSCHTTQLMGLGACPCLEAVGKRHHQPKLCLRM